MSFGGKPTLAGYTAFVRPLLWAGLFAFIAGLAGCAAPSGTAKPQAGGLGAEGEAPPLATQWVRYRNKYFGFSIQVPGNWYRADNVFLRVYDKSKARFISGNSADLGEDIARENPRGIMLIAASRYPVSKTGGKFNDNLICTAIKVSDVPGVKTGEDYLRYVTSQGQRLVTPIKALKIHGRQYHVRAMRKKSRQDVTQQIVATVDKGYAFNCLLTFKTGTKPKEMFRAVATMRLEE